MRQWDSALPPCQLDRSLLHTERWRWMEVVELLAEGWCLPHIIQRRCSRRGLLDVPTTRRCHSAGRDIWYVYKQWALMPRPLVPLTVLCGSHTLCRGAAGEGRRKDVFHVTHYGTKTCPWDVTSCLTGNHWGRVMWCSSGTREESCAPYLRALFFPAFSNFSCISLL